MTRSAIPELEVQSALDRVAGSASFRKAPVLHDLLLYLWRNRGAVVSEYAIGTEVLGRKTDFDPKTDSAVRVHISRLRTRLKEYYESPVGELEVVRLQIPSGEYRLDYQVVTAEPAAAEPPQSSRRWWIACAALGVLSAGLAYDNYRLRSRAGADVPPIDRFWQPMVTKGKPVAIIVPAPLFFRWENSPLVVRDFRVNRPDDGKMSEQLEKLFQLYGKPETSHLYTVASDTVAASAVSRYLEDRGVPAKVLDTPAATMDMLDSQDAIVFLGPGSSHQVPNVMDRLGYAFDRSPTGTARGFADTKSGKLYPTKVHSPLRTTGHGVIAMLPGKAPNTRLLVVASAFNPALATLLTSQTELGVLRAFLDQRQAGESFEAIIQYEVSAERVLDAKAVDARALSR